MKIQNVQRENYDKLETRSNQKRKLTDCRSPRGESTAATVKLPEMGRSARFVTGTVSRCTTGFRHQEHQSNVRTSHSQKLPRNLSANDVNELRGSPIRSAGILLEYM